MSPWKGAEVEPLEPRGQGILVIKVRKGGGDVVRLGDELERLWCKEEVCGSVCGGALAAITLRLQGRDVASFRCTLPTEGMRSIISTIFVSLEGFLPSILLLVVIIVAIVIVAAILVIVVVVIVRVVISVTIIGVVVMIIRVVVVGGGGGGDGVSFIIKLSFMIIGFLHRITLYYLIH
ncbi:hypothetical protein Tco_0720502 [Tanacetum coccineum]